MVGTANVPPTESADSGQYARHWQGRGKIQNLSRSSSLSPEDSKLVVIAGAQTRNIPLAETTKDTIRRPLVSTLQRERYINEQGESQRVSPNPMLKPEGKEERDKTLTRRHSHH